MSLNGFGWLKVFFYGADADRPASPDRPESAYISTDTGALSVAVPDGAGGLDWQAVGGSGSTACVLLASGRVTGSSVSSISLTSISGSYKTLRLLLHLRGTKSATTDLLKVQLNGDTTAAHYHGTYFGFQNTGTAASQNDGIRATMVDYEMPAASADSSLWGGTSVDFFDYAETVKIKTCNWQSDSAVSLSSGNIGARVGTGLINSASAITQIDISAAGGNIAVDSSYELYGFG